MLIRPLLSRLVLAFACLPLSPAAAAEQDAATRALVEKIVAAHGGAANIEGAATLEAEGEIVALMRGGQGSYRRWLSRPRLLRVETVYPRDAETRILNGQRVWRGGAAGQKEVAGQGWLAVVYQYKQLDLPYGLLKGHYDLRHAGRERLDGVETEVLEVRDAEGPPMRLNVDAAEHRIVRVAGHFSHGGMGIDLGIAFSDFRPVRGLPLPHRMRNYAGGQAVSETLIRRYRVNPDPDPTRFLPAPVGADMVRAAAGPAGS